MCFILWIMNYKIYKCFYLHFVKSEKEGRLVIKDFSFFIEIPLLNNIKKHQRFLKRNFRKISKSFKNKKKCGLFCMVV